MLSRLAASNPWVGITGSVFRSTHCLEMCRGGHRSAPGPAPTSYLNHITAQIKKCRLKDIHSVTATDLWRSNPIS
ncbi:hypothetical protein H671_1g4310 [Cricetulus griseus]|nr:hypothetical protein H671_1g4310 [Cricetulus griseus]